MRFEYLSLADAANRTSDGKTNVLGLGVRILRFETLPATPPIAIVGAIEAPTSEAGEYDVVLTMVEPDGTETEVFQARGTIPSDVEDDRVPTGIGFTVRLGKALEQEGLHTIRATIGTCVADYTFLVQRNQAK